jgi:peptide/nickel transport system permease protein
MQNVTVSIRNARFQYRLGWVLLILLVLVAVFGHQLMPYEITPETNQSYEWQIVDGKKTIVTAPFPPSSQHWLGTDHRGYDVLSLLLNGAKYTLGFALAVTVARFLIAMPLGLFAGATGRGKGLISTIQLAVSSVPQLLFVFPTMYGLYQAYGLNGGMESSDSKQTLFAVLLFALLTLIGVFQLAHQFAQRADFYGGKLFVTASETMGASTGRIVRRHLLPHLRPEIQYAFLTDFVQVLFLIGQLAVLDIFLGGGEMFVIDPITPIVMTMTTTGEWGALIAYGTKVIQKYPWILAAPGCFFTAAVLILSYFAKQVRQRYSMPSLYSTVPFLQNKRRVALTAGGVAAAVLLLLWNPGGAVPAVSQVSADQQAAINRDIQNTVMQVIGYAQQGDLSSARAYMSNPPPEFKLQRPSETLGRWSKALKQGGYTFKELGEISVSDLSDKYNFYQVEVRVAPPSGTTETWKIITTPHSRNFGTRVIGLIDGPK